MKRLLTLLLLIGGCSLGLQAFRKAPKYSSYLFVFFSNNSPEGE